MCGGPRDGALLRLSLANALLAEDDVAAALVELRATLGFDPGFSAAWKLLAQLLASNGETSDARAAYQAGIAAAATRGDKQAEKEMRVFLRRLEKAAPSAADTPAS
jgi:predicted Zn-dependent protease